MKQAFDDHKHGKPLDFGERSTLRNRTVIFRNDKPFMMPAATNGNAQVGGTVREFNIGVAVVEEASECGK